MLLSLTSPACVLSSTATPARSADQPCLCACTGVLGGDIVRLNLRFSPGFCDAEWGAVEDIDWRDFEMVGLLRTAMRVLIYVHMRFLHA